MIIVAAIAVAFATVWVYLPWLRWRMRVDGIIANKLASPDKLQVLFSSPTFQRYNKLTAPEYEDVLHGPRYVCERLLAAALADRDAQRRSAAFSTLGSVLGEAGSPALAREFLGRVLELAVGGKLPADGEQSSIMVVEQVGLKLGLNDSQRSAIIGRVRELARDPAPGDLLRTWVSLVGQIGGPAETELLLELEDARDPESLTFGQGSRLMHSRLPILLDHIRRWLDIPIRATGALDYTILPCTEQGRRLLLDVVLTPGRDPAVRRKAMRLLKRDTHGLELLLSACENPDQRRLLGQLYGPDHYNTTVWSNGLPAKLDGWYLSTDLAEVKNPDDPRPELRELRLGRDEMYPPWPTLVWGVAPSSWSHVKRRLLEKGKSEAEAEHIVHEIAKADLAIAQELSGRHELITPAEWQTWYHEAAPNAKLIPLRRWIDQMIAHADLMTVKEFGSTINLTHSVSPELVPALAQLARAAPPGARWRPGQTLLLFADRAEEAPLLIDDIEQEVRDHPARFADRNLMPGRILRWRFGVNYFWDVAAWRQWWKGYQRNLSSAARAQPSG